MTIIWITLISLSFVLGLGQYTTVKADNAERSAQVQAVTMDDLQPFTIKKPAKLHTLDGITVQDLSGDVR